MLPRMYFYIFIFYSFVSIEIQQLNAAKPNLVIYDTANLEQCIMQPFIDALNNDWNVKYTPLDQVMDLNLDEVSTGQTRSAFFIFGIEFLRGLHTSSPVSQKIVKLVKKYGIDKDKLIGLSFPSITVSPETNLIKKFDSIFETFYTTSDQSFDTSLTETQFIRPNIPKNLKAFSIIANNFLTHPLEGRTLKYHTTLSFPHPGLNFYTPECQQIIMANKQCLKFLPENSKFSESIKETVPYGLYFINKNNHIFITQNSLLSFSGITENCHLCPMRFKQRNELLKGMCDTVSQATKIFLHSKNLIDLVTTYTNEQTTSLVKMGQKINSTEPSLRKTAWMEINIFASQGQVPDSTKGQQEQLISYIINSKLDTLWINICPNCFYSPIALQKHNEKRMLDSISNFTFQLKSSCQKNNFKLPKILIGFEIANNLYKDGIPKISAQDIYGNVYFDIPDPLNADFWRDEVEIPLTKFVSQWNKPEIGNGVEISGVMIDLEMYGRKSSAIFLPTMGISQDNLSEFFKEQNIKPGPMTSGGVLSYLMSNKLSQKYFEFLEIKAKLLGEQLKQTFDKCIPKCNIALYMPNILASWFYKGLYQGLCKADQPLYLFSFNTEFSYHKNWFIRNKINAHHSSVLLLSKLSNSENFKLANKVLSRHHGIWLNRFSRLIEKRSNDWTAVEKPTFPEKFRVKLTDDFVQHLGKL